eukprot:GFKZ01013676.1.p2 GENE.GFKZ01013676.1~~GFKZ01013676.1.p2  ORF type:complete len:546 (-),score=80.24 GFKZ01013676.1:2114-3751(-)
MATFKPPVIHDNPDGWGPPMELAPAKFQDMPYAPFSKSDRLGRAADWTAFGNRYGHEPGAEDPASKFTMVDNKPILRSSRPGRGRGGFRGSQRGRNTGRYGERGVNNRDGGRRPTRGGRAATRNTKGPHRPRWDDRRNVQRESSVEVGTDWVQLEEITAGALSKMTFSRVSEGEDLAKCGALPYFDRALDRVTAKNPRRLSSYQVEYPRVTTTDDPVIRRIAGNGEGTVFATAGILALLMAAPRAVQSWDVIVQRIEGKLFFDKRDGSMVDCITVNETSHDSPKDEKNLTGDEVINSFQKLAEEAGKINENFIQAVTSKTGVYKYPEGNPFEDEVEGTPASIGYRYRKWNLGDDITLVARCELEAAFKPAAEGAEPVPICIRALNEFFDPNARQSTDWRGKLDTQRGAVLATEVKNNASKLARWTAEAILADADRLKFGFVSRVKAGRNDVHTILGTQMYRPREFANQIALNTNNMWGILKGIIDIVYKNLGDGEKGLLLKDPNKPIIRLYRVPDDAFEEDEEDDADEDDEDADGEQQTGLFLVM